MYPAPRRHHFCLLGSVILTFIIQSLGPKAPEISAELAALMLLDQIRYEELALTDVYASVLSIDSNATSIQEVERKPGKGYRSYPKEVTLSQCFQLKRPTILCQSLSAVRSGLHSSL